MAVGDFPVNGKIAVVTGGGSGIGLAISKLFINQGAKVLIGDLKLTPNAEAFITNNENCRFTKCDVTDWKDLANLIAVSEKEFGDIPDIYVPNAGVCDPKWSNFWDDSEEHRYAQLDINISHPIKLTRFAMRTLLSRNKKGVVCCVASSAGLLAIYSAPLYCASKHAVIGFVRSMGMADVEEGVKVVGICPGTVMTPLWTDRPDAQEKMKEYGIGATPYLTADDCAKAMLKLVEDKNYSGGTVLKLDIGVEEVIFPGVTESDISAMPPDVLEAVNKASRSVRKLMKEERDCKS